MAELENPKTIPALDAEIQRLRLAQAEQDERIRRLTQEIERLRAVAKEQTAEQSAQELESLFSEVSSPVSQLLLQQDMLNIQHKDIHAKDVLLVTGRLIRGLLAHGLELVGKPGEQAAYSTAEHAPLSASFQPAEGDPVKVILVGTRYRGKILRKAAVERI